MTMCTLERPSCTMSRQHDVVGDWYAYCRILQSEYTWCHGGYDNSHPIHRVHDVIYVHNLSKSNDLGVFTILRYRPTWVVRLKNQFCFFHFFLHHWPFICHDLRKNWSMGGIFSTLFFYSIFIVHLDIVSRNVTGHFKWAYLKSCILDNIAGN